MVDSESDGGNGDHPALTISYVILKATLSLWDTHVPSSTENRISFRIRASFQPQANSIVLSSVVSVCIRPGCSCDGAHTDRRIE